MPALQTPYRLSCDDDGDVLRQRAGHRRSRWDDATGPGLMIAVHAASFLLVAAVVCGMTMAGILTAQHLGASATASITPSSHRGIVPVLSSR